jgi:VIT1/CCC1 family predicted Fe2+/Mn2+ transporter
LGDGPIARDGENGGVAAMTARALQPVERIEEALFGLIMVLTFTCSMGVAEAGRDDVRTMLIGAVGCNLAWGIIDAVMFLMGCLAERGSGLGILRSVRGAASAEDGQRIVAGALPPMVASALRPGELEHLRQQLSLLPEPSARPRLGANDWLGGLGVLLWVFLITFPVAVPFVFVHDLHRALRLSNLIAVALLFVTGQAFGRAAGLNPWWTGTVMVFLGGALVALTIAFGG